MNVLCLAKFDRLKANPSWLYVLRRKFTACKMRSNLLCTEVAGASFLDACGEQEMQRTKMHGGPVRVIYRDDDGVIPRRAGRTYFKLRRWTQSPLKHLT